MKAKIILTVATSLLIAIGTVGAETLPKTHLNVIGTWSNLPQYKNFEQPFWTKEIPEKSGGAVTADIKGLNEMGLKGGEIGRSEENTSELQSLMRSSYAVFCLKNKKTEHTRIR